MRDPSGRWLPSDTTSSYRGTTARQLVGPELAAQRAELLALLPEADIALVAGERQPLRGAWSRLAVRLGMVHEGRPLTGRFTDAWAGKATSAATFSAWRAALGLAPGK